MAAVSEASPDAPAPVTLAWHWVVEALADCKQISTSVIKEIVTREPDCLNDSLLGGTARERVSLRYLEECLDSTRCSSSKRQTSVNIAHLTPPPSVLEGSHCAVEVSGRSSEDVLCNYLQKANALNDSEKSMDDIYLCELQNFVLQKRTVLSKHFLDLLKDAVLKDCDRFASSLAENGEDIRGSSLGYQSIECSRKHPGEEILRLPKDSIKFSSISHMVPSDKMLEKNCAVDSLVTSQKTYIHPDDDKLQEESRKIASAAFDYEDKAQAAPLDRTTFEHSSSVQNKCPESEPNEVPQSCSDKDECRDVASEIEFVASEKSRLLSTQKLIVPDSVFGTEQQTCTKCDQGGQLLFCSDSDCPFAFHESCLGSAFCFENMGDFYCPFCLYLKAAIAYCEASKKYSLAKKAISSFMGYGNDNKRKPQLEAAMMEIRFDKKFDDLDKTIGIESSKLVTQQNQTKITSENITADLQERGSLPAFVDKDNAIPSAMADAEPVDRNESVFAGEYPQESDHAMTSKQVHNILVKPTIGMIPMVGTNEGGNNDQSTLMEDEDQHKELSKRSNANGMSGPPQPKHLNDDINLEHVEESENHLQADASSVCDSDSTRKQTASPLLDRHVQTRKKRAAPFQVHTSKKSGKISKRHKRYSNPIYPCGRRNRLPWTEEEVEFLKDAVGKLSDAKSNIPWREILECGNHVLHKTRQPMDLKDKWRNMKKNVDKA